MGPIRAGKRGITIAPVRWRFGPDDFQSAGDGVVSVASAKAVVPAEVLLLKGGGFRHRAQG